MKLLSRLFGRKSETRSSRHLPSAYGMGFGGFGGSYNDSGIDVNESNALAASSVYACVKILAESVAQLPLHVYRRREGEKDYEHPVAHLLSAEPNDMMTSSTFRESLMVGLSLWGNAYAYIERNAAGVPVGLYPLSSAVTRPVRQNGELFYITQNGNGSVTLMPEQVLHLLNFSLDGGITGISPVQQAKQNIGLGLAMERFAAKTFSQGMNAGGILRLPAMNEEAMKTFVQNWRNSYTGLDAAFDVAVLPSGFDFVRTTMNAEEGQVMDARVHQVLEICRVFNVPPHKLGILEKSSFASLEQQDMAFYQGTIQPIVKKWEEEINRKLLLEREKPTHEVRFNLDAMLRASTKERLEAYDIGIRSGVYTRADCRAKESLHFIPGSDELLMPLNMAAVAPTQLASPNPTPASTPSPEASRSLVEDAARRLLTKESKALLRAAKKHAGKPDELRSWGESWYATHEPLVARTLTAPLAAAGVKITAADYARQHCAESLRAITAAIDPYDLADEWDTIRPIEIAQDLLKDTK